MQKICNGETKRSYVRSRKKTYGAHMGICLQKGNFGFSKSLKCRTFSCNDILLLCIIANISKWAFSFFPRSPSSLSCINKYLAIDSGGNMSE